MRQNKLRVLWNAGRPALGGWCALSDSFSAEIMASSGFDWICVDTQHGLVDFQQAVQMLQAISTTDAVPLVRVPANDAPTIGRVLDAGARGVIVPMVNSPSDAVAAASACRYPPAGVRSFGPIRAAFYAGVDYYEHSNADVVCVVMVETRQAVEAVEQIAAVEGIDAILIGPADLSITLGLPPGADTKNPQFVSAVAHVLAACRAHNVHAGIAATAVNAAEWISEGFSFVGIANDALLLSAAARTAVDTARGGPKMTDKVPSIR
jgi:4-hydroxy-2-oxoheptanedioate aldolase